MKDRVLSLAFLAGVYLLSFLCFAFGLVEPSYSEARRQLAWSYFNSLEMPLADARMGDIEQLETSLCEFERNFIALKVGNNHKPALVKARDIVAQARALRETLPAVDAAARQRAFDQLRQEVKLVPRIGKQAFFENNPWLTGIIHYAWECWVLPGCLLAWVVSVSLSALCISTSSLHSSSDDSQSSDDSGASGGGFGGGSGEYYGGGGGGDFGGYRGPMGSYYQPPYPGAPGGSFGGGYNNGYPPWGSV